MTEVGRAALFRSFDLKICCHILFFPNECFVMNIGFVKLSGTRERRKSEWAELRASHIADAHRQITTGMLRFGVPKLALSGGKCYWYAAISSCLVTTWKKEVLSALCLLNTDTKHRSDPEVKHEALVGLWVSSCHYQKKKLKKYKKRYFIFRADPSMMYTGGDIFPDSPLFRERLLCRLARSLRSLARELFATRWEK